MTTITPALIPLVGKYLDNNLKFDCGNARSQVVSNTSSNTRDYKKPTRICTRYTLNEPFIKTNKAFTIEEEE